jgi:hypothetical protein
VISPGIYNVSNGFTFYGYFGCLASLDGPLVKAFSDLTISSVRCNEPWLPSRVEKEETLHTPIRGDFWQDTDV